MKFTYKSEISECGTGIIFKSYFGNVTCNNIKVTGHLAKRRSALQLILSDICECLDIFELITFDGERKYSKFLYKAFVITYGKCFAGGEERGISLSAKKVFKNDKEMLQKHRQIIELRNKYVAHSDSSIYEMSEVYLASSGDQQELFVPTQKYTHPIGSSLVGHEDLVVYVYEHVNEQISKVEKAILQQ
ncbi:TPA: hypothetical protein NKA25_001176 [Vibrio parahaemolyticus]|nr:hypothetical protein [Vibrio parahaemolyticus]